MFPHGFFGGPLLRRTAQVFPCGFITGVLLTAALSASLGCDSGQASGGTAQEREAPRAEGTATPLSNAPGALFAGDARWYSYEDGLKQAHATGKPLCVVVYADWCGRCRELDQAMRTPRFAELMQRFVMVRQDADAGAAWLTAPPFAQHGTYVPRLFFLTKEGALRPELKSPHPRFPYFYSAAEPQALEKSMLAALGG